MDSVRKPRLKDRFTTICRTRHLSYSTEQSYWGWVSRFIKYHAIRSENELMTHPELKFSGFISHIAPNVSPSTQSQAWNALLCLYRDVLAVNLGVIPDARRAKRKTCIRPVPCDHNEVLRLLESVQGKSQLILRLIYGSALRLQECLRLRLKDLDFANGQILIYDGKGAKDAFVPMPESLRAHLEAAISDREAQHRKDKIAGDGWVWLPESVGRKYPKWHFRTDWQYLFASERISKDPRSGNLGRHHITPESVQQAMARACGRAGIKKHFTPHSLRHAAARFAERNGTPVSEIQRWLRHADVETTMRYLGMGEQRMAKVVGPLG